MNDLCFSFNRKYKNSNQFFYLFIVIVLFNIYKCFCLQQNLRETNNKIQNNLKYISQPTSISTNLIVKSNQNEKIENPKKAYSESEQAIQLQKYEIKSQRESNRKILSNENIDLKKQKPKMLFEEQTEKSIIKQKKLNQFIQSQNTQRSLQKPIQNTIDKKYPSIQIFQNQIHMSQNSQKNGIQLQNQIINQDQIKKQINLNSVKQKKENNKNQKEGNIRLYNKQLDNKTKNNNNQQVSITNKKQVNGFFESQNHKNKIASITSPNIYYVAQSLPNYQGVQGVVYPNYQYSVYRAIQPIQPVQYVTAIPPNYPYQYNPYGYYSVQVVPPFNIINQKTILQQTSTQPQINPVQQQKKSIPTQIVSNTSKNQTPTTSVLEKKQSSLPINQSAPAQPDGLSSLITGILQSSNQVRTQNKTNNTQIKLPSTPNVANITTSSTFQMLNAQVQNNIVSHVMNLIPSIDQKFYETNSGEKVYDFRNIDLNITNNNTVSNTPAIGPNSILTLNITRNATNSSLNTNATSQPLIPSGGTLIPFNSANNISGVSTNNTIQTSLNNATTIVDNSSNSNTTIKKPVVNGTLTGNYLAPSSTPSGSQVKLKYQQYLLKFKPNPKNQNQNQLSVYRQTIFNLHINNINQHNSNPNKTYTLGVNLFTDLTEDQFNRQFAKLNVPDSVINQSISQANALQNQGKTVFTTPEQISIDWTCLSSPVISQGVCGACYAIAALEAIQMTMRIYRLPVSYLSIQQVISCGFNGRDLNGCINGFFSGAYNYSKNIGVGQYPSYFYDDQAKFQGVLSKCNQQIVKNKLYVKSKVFIKQSQLIRYGDCKQIVNQLKNRVLTVAIAAYGLQFYSDGVFQTENKNINHGVTLVGYEPGVGAGGTGGYLIKNSWGSVWGKKGYGYISSSTGLCNFAMYPILYNQTNPRMTCTATENKNIIG